MKDYIGDNSGFAVNTFYFKKNSPLQASCVVPLWQEIKNIFPSSGFMFDEIITNIGILEQKLKEFVDKKPKIEENH